MLYYKGGNGGFVNFNAPYRIKDIPSLIKNDSTDNVDFESNDSMHKYSWIKIFNYPDTMSKFDKCLRKIKSQLKKKQRVSSLNDIKPEKDMNSVIAWIDNDGPCRQRHGAWNQGAVKITTDEAKDMLKNQRFSFSGVTNSLRWETYDDEQTLIFVTAAKSDLY